jgi:hypothetical protein
MSFDYSQFDTYGLSYKVVNGITYIRPQWLKSGKEGKRWSNVQTKRGKDILDYATAGNVDLLYKDQDIFLYGDRKNMGMTGPDYLRFIIDPLLKEGRYILNFAGGKEDKYEWKRLNCAKILTKETSYKEYYKIADALDKFEGFYYDTEEHDIYFQLILLPENNPELENIKDGKFNCVILPVILLLQKQKSTKANQARIDKLLKYHAQVKDGLNNEGILHVSKLSRINIAIYDHCDKLWHKFVTGKNKTLLLDVHNNHATVRNDEQLKHQVYTHQKKSTFDIILAEPLNLEVFNEQEVKWVNKEELDKLLIKHLDAHIIQSKGTPKALITSTTIYKLPFDEHENYPDSFTDGGVGKQKFLEQNPHMKTPKIHPVLWDADRSGFYMRSGKSHINNIKFDMNHSYKSFKNSNCFKGFPEQIDTVLSFPDNTTATQSKTFHHDGLLYVEYPALDDTYFKKTNNKYKQIYYECSGWYPIEIVEEIYKLYKIDPIVKAVAIGQDTFDIDITKFTNPQFRSFVGKTTSKYVSDTWRTTDKNEYLRALYQLQDKIIGINEHTVRTGGTTGKRANQKLLYYSIEYVEPDKTPWQCPVIAVYVKAHQKLQMFKQYNQLVSNGMLPRYISVDGIEISGNQRNKAIPLFNTDWKQEEIKIADFITIGFIERKIPDIEKNIPLYETFKPLPRLLHLSGSGGNGKTEYVVKLAKQYNNMCFTATTHNACSELEIRGKKLNIDIKADTYHRIFGIGTKYPQIPNASIFVIEEASMLSDEHLQLINQALKDKFNSDKSFGGKRIILVGDFWQLPVLSPMTPMYDPWTDEKTPLYEQFTVHNLTTNWRQKADPEFYALCQKIRNKLTKQEALAIIEELNERCIADEDDNIHLPSAHSINDIYMAGVNIQCDVVNKEKYDKIKPNTKIINTKTFKYTKPAYMTEAVFLHDGSSINFTGAEASSISAIFHY